MNESRLPLIRHRMERTHETLRAARTLLETGFFHACVNRLYYACFYAVSALLLTDGFAASRHGQIIAAFNKRWIKEGGFPKEMGRLFSTLFAGRQEADYSDMAEFTAAEVTAWRHAAEAFVDQADATISKDQLK